MRKLKPNERKQKNVIYLINDKVKLKPSLLTPKLNVAYTILE